MAMVVYVPGRYQGRDVARDKGALAGAKVMAASILECLKDPAIVEEAKRTFKEELGGVEYKSMLPPDQKPPVDLNRALANANVAKSQRMSRVLSVLRRSTRSNDSIPALRGRRWMTHGTVA
jgi:hypothetical protein